MPTKIQFGAILVLMLGLGTTAIAAEVPVIDPMQALRNKLAAKNLSANRKALRRVLWGAGVGASRAVVLDTTSGSRHPHVPIGTRPVGL